MLRKILCLVFIASLSLAASAQRAWLHPALENLVQQNKEGTLRIGMVLHEQVNALQLKYDMAAAGLTAQERAKTVIQHAYALQAAHQRPFLVKLEGK